MKKTRRKINTVFGFTLAETLLAILIMLMAAALMTTGIPAAKNAYEKVVLASNAELLLSTTMTELRNELSLAREVEASAGAPGEGESGIRYRDNTNGLQSRIFLGEDNGQTTIMIEKGSTQRRLISRAASTRDLYVSYTGISCDAGVVTFTGLSVKRTGDGAELASRDELSIRVMSDE